MQGEEKVSDPANVSVANYYGTEKISAKTPEQLEDTALEYGPWVEIGGRNAKATAWKQAFGKSSEGENGTTVNCGVTRLIGPIPQSVIPKSSSAGSIKLFWGEMTGFIDIKSGEDYEVENGYKIMDSSKNIVSEKAGTAFTVSWEDTNSYASGLLATAAAAAFLLMQAF